MTVYTFSMLPTLSKTRSLPGGVHTTPRDRLIDVFLKTTYRPQEGGDLSSSNLKGIYDLFFNVISDGFVEI